MQFETKYAVILCWMQQKYEFIIVLHETLRLQTHLFTLFLFAQVIALCISACLVWSPVHTGLLERFYGRCPSLLFLMIYSIEGCNHLSNSENLVFRFSLLLYHTATDKSLLHITASLTEQPGFGFISQISSCWKTIFLALFDECTTFWMSQSKSFQEAMVSVDCLPA